MQFRSDRLEISSVRFVAIHPVGLHAGLPANCYYHAPLCCIIFGAIRTIYLGPSNSIRTCPAIIVAISISKASAILRSDARLVGICVTTKVAMYSVGERPRKPLFFKDAGLEYAAEKIRYMRQNNSRTTLSCGTGRSLGRGSNIRAPDARYLQFRRVRKDRIPRPRNSATTFLGVSKLTQG